jgi:hypothetical protein
LCFDKQGLYYPSQTLVPTLRDEAGFSRHSWSIILSETVISIDTWPIVRFFLGGGGGAELVFWRAALMNVACKYWLTLTYLCEVDELRDIQRVINVRGMILVSPL